MSEGRSRGRSGMDKGGTEKGGRRDGGVRSQISHLGRRGEGAPKVHIVLRLPRELHVRLVGGQALSHCYLRLFGSCAVTIRRDRSPRVQQPSVTLLIHHLSLRPSPGAPRPG